MMTDDQLEDLLYQIADKVDLRDADLDGMRDGFRFGFICGVHMVLDWLVENIPESAGRWCAWLELSKEQN